MFSGAMFSGAIFSGAIVNGAIVSGAIFSGAIVSGARLACAICTRVFMSSGRPLLFVVGVDTLTGALWSKAVE